MIRITAAEGVRIHHLIDEDGIHPECTMRGHLPSIEIRAGGEMNERYEIGEAKFYLERMEESISDRVAFRYYLSPFLSAVRSVLQYAKEESYQKGRKLLYLDR